MCTKWVWEAGGGEKGATGMGDGEIRGESSSMQLDEGTRNFVGIISTRMFSAW